MKYQSARVRCALTAGVAAVGLGVAFAAPASAAQEQAQDAGVQKASPELVAEVLGSAEALRPEASTDRASYGCNGNEVSNNSYVHVCYVRNGDVIWLHDDEANGRTAYAQIVGYDSTGAQGAGWYTALCRDDYSSSGPWDHCSFSWIDENTTVAYRGFDYKSGTSNQHFTPWHYEPSS